VEPFALSSPDDCTALLMAMYRRQLTGNPVHDEEIYCTLR